MINMCIEIKQSLQNNTLPTVDHNVRKLVWSELQNIVHYPAIDYVWIILHEGNYD